MASNFVPDPVTERILLSIAGKYAPRLVPKPDEPKKPLPVLARQLANYHVLVLLADRQLQHGGVSVPIAVQECSEIYASMYRLLAGAAFTSLMHISSFFYLGRSSVITIFEAEARRVVEVLAGYVSPYVAARQGTQSVTYLELNGLMDKALQRLDLPTLSPDEYNRLRHEGSTIITRMLNMRLRQIRLTEFDEPFFDDIAPQRPPLPPLDRLPGQVTSPFPEGTLPLAGGDEPDFIRKMSEPEPPKVTPKSAPPTPDTGPNDAIPDAGEQSRLIPPPAQAANGVPLPPLPPPKRRKPKKP